MNKLSSFSLLLLTMLASTAHAYEKVKLEKQGGMFSNMENFLQTVIDFFQGPYAVAIAFCGVLMVVFGIIFARDAGGIIGMGLRVVAGVGIIFAIAPILGYFM